MVIRLNLLALATILVIFASSGCASFGKGKDGKADNGNGNGNGNDDDVPLNLAPKPKEINKLIECCETKPPDEHCRNDVLTKGLAYYEHKFLDRTAGDRWQVVSSKAADVVEGTTSIVLPVVSLNEDEEDKAPILFPLIRIIKGLFGVEDKRVKLAEAE